MIVGAQELGVAVVGTARARRGWPAKEIKDIKDDRFNTLYWLNDKKDYQIQRWVDNNIVTMVTSFHTAEKTITRIRKKPRVTSTNKKHLNKVWQ